MPSLLVRILKLDRFEPNRIVTSNIVRPRTLLLIRAFGFLYVLAASISVWATTDNVVDYQASTVWGILFLRLSGPIGSKADLPGGELCALVALFNNSNLLCGGACHLLGLLSWNMPSWTPLDYYQNISVHAMGGFFGTIVELISNRHFLQPVHSLFVAAVMILYMLLTFVVYAIHGEW
ncbi:hypothetical protein BGZ65_000866 [Modicella reniformis]|uniref:Uncharacterized protein n=1 Tax=Modicella reniformis TaxID=1440133 RepID=A0A9P6ILZ2_9FUNG|nr:hypothetical protein BGZ65_000866 [Modicella reniformis]